MAPAYPMVPFTRASLSMVRHITRRQRSRLLQSTSCRTTSQRSGKYLQTAFTVGGVVCWGTSYQMHAMYMEAHRLTFYACAIAYLHSTQSKITRYKIQDTGDCPSVACVIR
ncbi:hypothetical protein BDW02DRAFT_565731 [Decorospora gaudefroyi]|uniref:Uncharacterized protein n=1 Tax=Decorospora gaudefroyi TaxID=184978 RepID=A0A6A5KSC7_9PLEO|nr:hypothetical protein BDW02DRAFT_565731 [Decorospora gaudefroyi]